MSKKKDEIFVGVRGEEVMAATTLKGLCDELGVSYSTAKDGRRSEGPEWGLGVWLRVNGDRGGDPKGAWLVKRIVLKRVRGRGAGGERGNLVPRGTSGNPLPGGRLVE